MTPPGFWQFGRTPPWPLETLSRLTAAATARRVARPGWAAPVPVICCGNASSGGAGKTPLALDLGRRLRARGASVAFLTRGHGGSARTPLRVAGQDAALVGDEALLLAGIAPCYVGADRAATARLAIADGADVLVMDDGLQNPGLAKTLSLLVIDGGAGFGNGHVIPAGPLREPVARAAARCHAAVLIGADRTDAAGQLPDGLPVLRAVLAPDPADLAALPPRLLAFAGIGRPQKFFDTLSESGHAPMATRAFPDHHPYTARDLQRLQDEARHLDATLVTTAKDLVRLPLALRPAILTLRVSLDWRDETDIDRLLCQAWARP